MLLIDHADVFNFNAGFDDSTDDDTFREFVIDPAAFLIGRGGELVIFITRNDENGFFNLNLAEPDSPQGESKAQAKDDDRDLFETNLMLSNDEAGLKAYLNPAQASISTK